MGIVTFGWFSQSKFGCAVFARPRWHPLLSRQQKMAFSFTVKFVSCSVLSLAVALNFASLADQVHTRLPSEDVGGKAVRERDHLTPDSSLLFNGLGLSPAGEHVRISDM